MEEGEKNSSRTWNSWSRQNCQPCWNLFYAEARKVSGRKTIQSNHCESQFVPGWTDIFLVPLASKKAVSIIRDKYSSRQTKLYRSISERSCATGIDFLHKAQAPNLQQRPWSPLGSKSAGSECSRKFCKFGLRKAVAEREAVKTNARSETRWPLAQNNNKPVEVLHLKRESDENSVHLQVLQILHILCFTDVNSETETHFFLVKFWTVRRNIWTKSVKFSSFWSKGRYEN